MRKYRVVVHGQDFTARCWIVLRGKFGFFVTCYVQAESVAEAEGKALSLVRDDPKVLMNSITVPTLSIDEVQEIESFDGCEVPRTGLAFYPAA